MLANSSFLQRLLRLQICHWYLAAVALSERVLKKVPGSVEAYLRFLQSGGPDFRWRH